MMPIIYRVLIKSMLFTVELNVKDKYLSLYEKDRKKWMKIENEFLAVWLGRALSFPFSIMINNFVYLNTYIYLVVVASVGFCFCNW